MDRFLRINTDVSGTTLAQELARWAPDVFQRYSGDEMTVSLATPVAVQSDTISMIIANVQWYDIWYGFAIGFVICFGLQLGWYAFLFLVKLKAQAGKGGISAREAVQREVWRTEMVRQIRAEVAEQANAYVRKLEAQYRAKVLELESRKGA